MAAVVVTECDGVAGTGAGGADVDARTAGMVPGAAAGFADALSTSDANRWWSLNEARLAVCEGPFVAGAGAEAGLGFGMF